MTINSTRAHFFSLSQYRTPIMTSAVAIERNLSMSKSSDPGTMFITSYAEAAVRMTISSAAIKPGADVRLLASVPSIAITNSESPK